MTEVAERYGRSPGYWRNACDQGRIAHFKDGNERIIDSDDLDKYWEERRVEPETPEHVHPVDAAIAAYKASQSPAARNSSPKRR